MDNKYILGLKGLAQFFNLSVPAVMLLLKKNGIPGAVKFKRQSSTNFTGGGRGVWALNRQLAEQYRHTRQNTPRYDPKRAADALVERFAGTGCQTVNDLIEMGYIDDMDWCQELNRWREHSNLHVPILMNPADLAEWFGGKQVEKITHQELFPATSEIFKKVRKRRS
jgi:hypothetical protein